MMNKKSVSNMLMALCIAMFMQSCDKPSEGNSCQENGQNSVSCATADSSTPVKKTTFTLTKFHSVGLFANGIAQGNCMASNQEFGGSDNEGNEYTSVPGACPKTIKSKGQTLTLLHVCPVKKGFQDMQYSFYDKMLSEDGSVMEMTVATAEKLCTEYNNQNQVN